MNLKRSMIPLWMNRHNKKQILKEKKLLKIKSFNFQNKEIKNIKINKLKLLIDTKRDLSKKKKNQTKL